MAAIEIMKLKHILILQNKIDLVKEGQAKEQHEQIVKFVQGTVAEGAPIIPISAQLKYNIEVCNLCLGGPKPNVSFWVVLVEYLIQSVDNKDYSILLKG